MRSNRALAQQTRGAAGCRQRWDGQASTPKSQPSPGQHPRTFGFAMLASVCAVKELAKRHCLLFSEGGGPRMSFDPSPPRY